MNGDLSFSNHDKQNKHEMKLDMVFLKKTMTKKVSVFGMFVNRIINGS